MKNKKQVVEVVKRAVEQFDKGNNIGFVYDIKRGIAFSGDMDMIISCFIPMNSEFYGIICDAFYNYYQSQDFDSIYDTFEEAMKIWEKYRVANKEAYLVVK